jgi:hypothetical protein
MLKNNFSKEGEINRFDVLGLRKCLKKIDDL